MFHSTRWRIALPYGVLVGLMMGLLVVYMLGEVERMGNERREETVLTYRWLLAEAARPGLLAGDHLALNGLARQWGQILAAQIVILDAEGVIIGESDDGDLGQLSRPEIQQAWIQRDECELGMGYSATICQDGELLGLVWIGLPLDKGDRGLNRELLAIGLLAIALAIGLGFMVAEQLLRPVRRLTATVQRMVDGELEAHLLVADPKGELDQLTLVFNDLSEQLRTQIAVLSEGQRRLVVILDHMADGVLIMDGSGRVEMINPAACHLLDTTPGNALSHTFAQVVRHHQFIYLWQRCQEQGLEQVETVEISQRALFLQVIITPLRDKDKEAEPHGYLVIFQNLTPIRRLETVRRDFISNISHELRTPLASLKAVVETLRDGALEDPPAAILFLDRADREVDALTQMVQELLELSRIESGKVPLRLRPTLLGEIILPPLDRLGPQVERGQLDLQMVLPAGLPLVMVDGERIQQVVTNLVHNAIKFTPAGGHILVQASREGQQIVVEVTDDGVGIPAGDSSRIFERFYKADRARSQGGTGLGLAIARHLVQAHGGEIWAKSKEGKGSTFYFTLPLSGRED